MLDVVLDQLPEASWWAPVLAFVGGVLLTATPTAFPAVPVVIAAVSPPASAPERRRESVVESTPSVIAFVAGMDGLLALVGIALVGVSEFFIRAGIVLHLVSASFMFVLGGRLLMRRSSLCERTGRLPPRPAGAFVFGVVFGVTGCPGCAPIVIGVGAAAGLVAGPQVGMLAVWAFVMGRSASLLLVAAIGARLLPPAVDDPRWRSADVVVGAIFVAVGLYYLARVLTGDVVTELPGTPGGRLALRPPS